MPVVQAKSTARRRVEARSMANSVGTIARQAKGQMSKSAHEVNQRTPEARHTGIQRAYSRRAARAGAGAGAGAGAAGCGRRRFLAMVRRDEVQGLRQHGEGRGQLAQLLAVDVE